MSFILDPTLGKKCVYLSYLGTIWFYIALWGHLHCREKSPSLFSLYKLSSLVMGTSSWNVSAPFPSFYFTIWLCIPFHYTFSFCFKNHYSYFVCCWPLNLLVFFQHLLWCLNKHDLNVFLNHFSQGVKHQRLQGFTMASGMYSAP